MLKLFILIYTLSASHATRPGKLFREEWGNQLMAINLVNLTQIICKDALYKLRMADRIQEEYKYTLSYELGILTSSITDYFKHMLRIYRFYSNHNDFKTKKHDINTLLNAYHIMQGEYNLIRAEKDLYYDVIERFRKQDEYDKKYKKRYPGLDPNLLKIVPPKRRAMGKLNITEKPKLGGKKKVWKLVNDTEEAAYKKSLRYKMWAQKWRGFNPNIEGINIPAKVAAVGLANASNFLVKELKGVI